jgi:hypothetical protein
MIRVSYDGDYPSTCMGRLRIFDGPELIYDKQFCCHSTGSVTTEGDPDEWNWVVECGELIWNREDASKFSKEIQLAVANKLSESRVCCGGCI